MSHVYVRTGQSPTSRTVHVGPTNSRSTPLTARPLLHSWRPDMTEPTHPNLTAELDAKGWDYRPSEEYDPSIHDGIITTEPYYAEPDEFHVDRLREAVRWAVKEVAAADDFDPDEDNYIGAWDQNTWARGRLPSEAEQFEGYWASHEFRNKVTVLDVSCGSTGCIAGHTVINAGDKLVAEVGDFVPLAGVPIAASGCVVPGTAEVLSIDQRARTLIGLSVYEGDKLFAGDNLIGDVIGYAQQIAAHRGLTL